MPVRVDPLPDASLVFREAFTDEVFGGAAIGVGGRGRDVLLATKSVAQIVIAAPDVLSESVATVSFVVGEIACPGVLAGTVLIRTGLAGNLSGARASRQDEKQQ